MKYFMISLLLLGAALYTFTAIAKQKPQQGYLYEQERNIAITEEGPHQGGGNTIAYRFFKNAVDSKLQFTKRILHPGSAIGYHLQKEEEIYYIISGTGEMTMNGKMFTVQAGDAILTFGGSSHGLKQVGKEDLVMIINYEKK